ncbi:MAG TPA: radical SAM protein [Polyangia bacterium]|nr:radical SAM protein [Polyangia bacterium]
MATSFELKQQARARLAVEQGTLRKESALPVALVYPSPYAVAMSSLGYQTIYREIHAHAGASAERAFLPDQPAAYRKSATPLFSYETQRPVSSFPIIAFSLAYELELSGLIECLHLAGLPPLAAQRGPHHPLVVIGGPLTFSNPLPAAPFGDLLVLGEAEESIHELLAAVREEPSRERLLARLAAQSGFFVPAAGRPLGDIRAADDARLPAYSQILTAETELSNMFLIEDARGCSRGCTYCVMGRWSGGMRVVPPAAVLARIPAHARRVGLVGAAVSDHPRLCDLVRALVEDGREVSLSSLRADRLTEELAQLLRRGGARSLTTASDGASERLRTFVDRKTKEKHLLRAAELAAQAGFERLKLYQMVGLPGETEADIDELARFSLALAGIAPRLALGIAPFVAKHRTPLDGAPFGPISSIERKLARLRAALRGRVEIRPTSARWAWVEYRLAQGGPEAGLAALAAWRAGGSFAAWKRALAEVPVPNVIMPSLERPPRTLRPLHVMGA